MNADKRVNTDCAQVKAMQEQVASAEAKALRAEEQLKEYQHQMGSMTPRPSWKALNTYGIIDTKGEKTQVQTGAGCANADLC